MEYHGEYEGVNSVDSDYLAELDAFFGVRLRRRLAEGNLNRAQIEIRYEEGDVARLERVIADLREEESRMRQTLDRHLEEDDVRQLPRLVRFVRMHELSKEQRFLLEYLLAFQGGGVSVDLSRGSMTFSEVCQALGWPIARLIELTTPDSFLIKSGVVELEDSRYVGFFSRRDIELSLPALKLFLGQPLCPDEFFSIDGTPLAGLLPCDPSNGMPLDLAGVCPEENKGRVEELDEEEDTDFAGEEAEGDMEEEEDFERDPSCSMEVESSEDPARSSVEPYETDLEYLEDCFSAMAALIRLKEKELNTDEICLSSDRSRESVLRELKSRYQTSAARVRARLERTCSSGWIPRLEEFSKRYELSKLERDVLTVLIGAQISVELIKCMGEMTSIGRGRPEVKELLVLFCGSLKERMDALKYFRKSAPLVKEGVLLVDGGLGFESLSEGEVSLDPRMIDYFTGQDTPCDEVLDGSHLYTPMVDLDRVVLPPEQKGAIVSAVENYDAFRAAKKALDMDGIVQYGDGLVLLFHGPSGTGKTMLANAIAHRLGKKILLINFATLGTMGDEVLRFVFREARINNAIVFFDECEAIFMSREKNNLQLGVLLTELERHDEPVIMATNRPFDLDEAMYRRITLASEFHNPDPVLRREIWEKHLPEKMVKADDVDLKTLAHKYELAGGFIKNAVLAALSRAVSRDREHPVVCHADLDYGAQQQLRGRLKMADLEQGVIPQVGMSELVLHPASQKALEEIVDFEKAREVLFGRWGFEKRWRSGRGTVALFHGEPGTGKTIAAEAVGYELGRHLKVINTAALVSKYVGDTAKNIETVFKEAKAQECVLVFDEAEGLLGHRAAGAESASDRYANLDTGVLLHHMEHYSGLVILITNLMKGLDQAFFRRFRFAVLFEKPEVAMRMRLWQSLLPAALPVADDIDFNLLAETYILSGGNIKNCIFKAAARAALRENGRQKVAMEDLIEAAEEESASAGNGRFGF